MGEEANVNINFNSKFNGEGAKQAENAIHRVQESSRKGEKNTENTNKHLGGMASQAALITRSFGGMADQIGGAGQLVGGMATGMGAALGSATALGAAVVLIGAAFGVATGAVNEYIKKAKDSTELGNEWAVQTDRLEQGYYDVGKALTAGVVPHLKEVIDLTEKVGGGISKQLNSFIAKFIPKDLFESGMKTIFGEDYFEKGKEQAFTPGKEISRDKLLEYRQLQLQEFEQDRQYNRQLFVMNRNFQKQEEYAILDYQKSRMRGERDFNRQLRYASEDFHKTEYRATRDFYRQEAITIEAFNRQRSIQSRDFQISVARNEYDYNKQRQRAQYDHNWSIRMAMLQGDAVSVWLANRQFKIEKQRAEEDYQLSKQRSIEDFQRSQGDQQTAFEIERENALKQFEITRADAEQDFNIQRRRSIEQYDIMRKDQEIDFQIQRDRTRYQYNVQLQDMQYQYNEEIRLRRQSFVERHLPELILEENMVALIRSQITEAEIQKYESWLAVIRGGNVQFQGKAGAGVTIGRGYASGGPVDQTGIAMVHRGEFVLTADTARAAQNMVKGNRLNQNSFLDLMSGGSVEIINNFSRGMSADEKFILQRQFEQMVKDGFKK